MSGTTGWIAGLALLAAAPWLLAHAWRRERAGRTARWGGWLALIAAMLALGAAAGGWVGVALALAWLPLPALLLVWQRRDRRPPRGHSSEPAAASGGSASALRRWLRGTWRALLALPASALAAVLLGAALARLGSSMPQGIVASICLAVLFWALAMVWALCDTRLLRPAGGLAVVTLVGALPLWLR